MKVLMYNNEQREAYWENNCLRVITIENLCYTNLGRIKKKNDGRWNWFYIPNKHGFVKEITPTKLQGTCSTKEDAMKILEGLWEYR